MPERGHPAPVDYVSLASFLAALAYPARLELLDILRFPHRLGEIRLAPLRAQGGSPERSAARETIRAHLEKLVETDLVRADKVEEDGRPAVRYTVNPQKLYAVTEEMRRLSTMTAGRGPAGDATGTLASAARAAQVTGPRLVLVHGVYEGKSYPLTTAAAQGGQWTIGRKRGLPVSLDYDPYVSVENATVTLRDGRYQVTDLKASKNGTWVNWAALPKGGTHALRAGDVIGVGRSLLSYVPE